MPEDVDEDDLPFPDVDADAVQEGIDAGAGDQVADEDLVDVDVEAAKDLRAAADCLDNARAELDHGDLEAPNEEVEDIVANVDEMIAELEATLRELAINSEVLEVEDADRD